MDMIWISDKFDKLVRQADTKRSFEIAHILTIQLSDQLLEIMFQ